MQDSPLHQELNPLRTELLDRLAEGFAKLLADHVHGYHSAKTGEFVGPNSELDRIPRLCDLTTEQMYVWFGLKLLQYVQVAKEDLSLSNAEFEQLAFRTSTEVTGLHLPEMALRKALSIHRFVHQLDKPVAINRSTNVMLLYAFYVREVLAIAIEDGELGFMLTDLVSPLIDDELQSTYNAEPLNLTAPAMVQYDISMQGMRRAAEGIVPEFASIVLAQRARSASTSKEVQPTSGSCFIATAVFHGQDRAPVRILRRFRDQRLGSNALGRILCSLYVTVGPYLAKAVAKHEHTKRAMRRILIVVARRISLNSKQT